VRCGRGALPKFLGLPLHIKLAVACFNCGNGLGGLLVDQTFGLLCLLSHHSLLICLLALCSLQLRRFVRLNGTCSMPRKLCSMPLDFLVLLLRSSAEVCLFVLSIFIDFLLELPRFIRNLLQTKL